MTALARRTSLLQSSTITYVVCLRDIFVIETDGVIGGRREDA